MAFPASNLQYLPVMVTNELKKLSPKMYKFGLSPPKKVVFICFNEIPLKMMTNAFYFILKAYFVLEMFKCCHDF